MQKRVQLTIDRESWTNAATAFQHPCPPVLLQSGPTDVQIFGSLLQVGILTVPPEAATFSLAAYWAHVSYITAVDLTAEFLQLRKGWDNLDPHQKTILSDDWGVGFTMHWLSSRLCYVEFCDGRYFIDRLKGLGIAQVIKPPKKRGTYKCPDFVTLDTYGKYHLIECKGTQSGSVHLQRQLEDGATQKANIIFSNEQSQVGQRLTAGIFVASAKSPERSLLAVADPPPRDHDSRSNENPVTVRIDDVPPERIADPLARGDIARQLQLGGASDVAAELLALPARRPQNQRSRRIGFKESVERFKYSAEVINERWLGRTVRIRLAEPVEIDGQSWRAVRLQHTISRDYIAALSEYDPGSETLTAQLPALGWGRPEAETSSQRRIGWYSLEEESGCVIDRAGMFRSEIKMET